MRRLLLCHLPRDLINAANQYLLPRRRHLLKLSSTNVHAHIQTRSSRLQSPDPIFYLVSFFKINSIQSLTKMTEIPFLFLFFSFLPGAMSGRDKILNTGARPLYYVSSSGVPLCIHVCRPLTFTFPVASKKKAPLPLTPPFFLSLSLSAPSLTAAPRGRYLSSQSTNDDRLS